MKQRITIIGSGLAGCFLAILFARKGYNVNVFEQFSESVMASNASRRSFTLTMYGYGVDTLTRVGLWDSLAHLFLRLEGSVTQIGHSKYRKPIIAFMDKVPFYAISRAGLLKGFLKIAKQHPSIIFHFGKSLVAINPTSKIIEVQDIKSKKISTVACDVIFGADGVNSKVREFLQKGQNQKLIKEQTGWSYKQVFFKKDLAKKTALRGNFSQNWTRKNAIFVAYPQHDASYRGMFILPEDSNHGFSSLKTKRVIKDFVFKYFPDFKPALPEITDAFLRNPEGHFVTIDTSPWYYKDFIAILGDAAHGFPPFYGQGVSAAVADCMELMQLVEKHGQNWKKIFPLYQKARKKNTDVLAHLSQQTLQNYRRERRADYTAIYARIESFLHSFFPKIFCPPPFMSVASDQPHAAEYVKRHQRQRIMAKFLGIPLVVAIITGTVAFHETMIKLYKYKAKI